MLGNASLGFGWGLEKEIFFQRDIFYSMGRSVMGCLVIKVWGIFIF